MASYIKRKFFKDTKPSQNQEVFKYCLADYDETYWLVNKILSFLCLKLNLQQSQHTSIFKNVIFYFIMMNVLMAAALEIISMILTASGGTLIELFTMMPCVGYVLVAISKAYKIKRYKPIYQNIVNELRSMWPVGQVTEEERNIIVDNFKSLGYVIKVLHEISYKYLNPAYFACTMALGSIFVLPPYIAIVKVLAGFKEVQRLLPFFYWLPFDPLQDKVYEVIMVIQSFHCLASTAFMLSGDILFSIFISHITTQFALLTGTINKMIYVTTDKQLLKSYPLGSYSKEQHLNNNDQGKNNGENETNLDENFVKIIHRHRALIRLSRDVENIYSFPLLVNFINSSIIICFCLFCVAFVEKWNEFNYKLFFITGILQIFILCWYGQKLLDTVCYYSLNYCMRIWNKIINNYIFFNNSQPTFIAVSYYDKSTGIGDALYNSGWYISSIKTKKYLLTMIHRSQSPVYITTFGFSILSLETYAMILRTSWSYFTLLINVYGD